MSKNQIGDRIKLRRLELGISQESLAKALGYNSRSSINKIELGLQGLPAKKIKKVTDILNVSPFYLMGWNEDAQKICNSIEENFSSLTAELFKLISELNESEQLELKGTIKQIIRERNKKV